MTVKGSREPSGLFQMKIAVVFFGWKIEFEEKHHLHLEGPKMQLESEFWDLRLGETSRSANLTLL